jgi:alpha-1,2-mannosyltransferase
MPVKAVALPALTKSFSRRAWLLRWRAGQRKTIYLCALVLGSCAFVLLVYLLKLWDEYKGQTPGHPPPFGDFIALWSYAKIASAHPVAELYDFATLHARQLALGMDPSDQAPFPYPPMFIVLLWPLSLLPYDVAYLVWIVGTLALFVWAVVGTCSRLPLCVFGAIVAPASATTIASGQSGFLAAALIISGVRLAGSRPILGGILIGILSYKPQFGFLVPIALASAGFWRAFAAASATTIGLAVLATLAFGWAVWPG